MPTAVAVVSADVPANVGDRVVILSSVGRLGCALKTEGQRNRQRARRNAGAAWLAYIETVLAGFG